MAEPINYFKNLMLAGYGSLVLTRERIENIVEELVDRGNVRESEADALIKSLQERATAERDMLTRMVKEQMQVIAKESSVVTRKELDAVAKRIDKLESLLD